MRHLLYISFMLTVACTSKSSSRGHTSQDTALLKDVKEHGATLYATFFTQPGQSLNKENAFQLKAGFILRKAFLDNLPDLSKALQYQLDSAFYLIAQKDTVWPSYVLPVANGQPLHPEFIIEFNKSQLKTSSVILQTHIEGLETSNVGGVNLEMSKINSQY